MRRGLLLLFLLCCLPACDQGDEPPLVVADIEITPPRPGADMSAGYLQVRNNSRDVISITRVDSPQFDRVAIHQTIMEDGVARMRPADAIVVPAGQTAVLERGGMHLMLMSPVPDVDRVTLNLYADDFLVVSVETEIRRGK